MITGASSGIGAALVDRLARPGVALLLLGRNHARTARAARRARALGAEAEAAAVDLRNAAELASVLGAFDDRHPVSLVLANAGVSSGPAPDGAPETRAAQQQVVEVNLIGAINTLDPLIPRLRARGAGRIVLVSSLAALRPMPGMAAYAASKAGLRAYGAALRGALAPDGVGVTVVCPGFVTTPMSERHLGPRPLEMPPERAAARILAAAARGRAVASFPLGLVLALRADALLPTALSDLIWRRVAPRILPDPGPVS